jgi:F-box protein 21
MTFLISRPQAADATRFITGVISVVKEQFPLDTEPVLAQALSHILGQNSHQTIGIQLRSAIGRLRGDAIEVKRRTKKGTPRWWVGLVFRHAKFNYVGVVLGWDEECAANEEWVRDAGVDLLPRGRKQPFYTVLAADGSSRCEQMFATNWPVADCGRFGRRGRGERDTTANTSDSDR